MSAERLHQAAQKIRSAASQTRGGVIEDWYGPAELNVILGRDAAHIALWSPPLAFAVADWLDDIATDKAEGTGCIHPRALALADLILGGTE